MKTIDAEIFAVGKWNGYPFSEQDLDGIVAAFDSLQAIHKVPLKFGHNDKQPMTDGQPALGWVDKVWREGKKLMATFSDVPEIVANAISKKLYRHVSSELSLGVSHQNKNYDYVLSGVALLGADIPAVNTLTDLQHYMGGGAKFSASHTMSFAVIQGAIKHKEEKTMDIEKQLADLTAKFSALSEQQTALATKNTTLEAENKTLKEQIETAKKAEHSAKVTSHRSMLTGMLETAVKAGQIIPGQREQALKFMRIGDDASVLDIKKEDVEEFIKVNGKKADIKFSRQTAVDTTEGEGDEAKSADVEIVRLARKLQAQHKDMTFSAAQQQVMEENPELAKAWLN